MNFLPPTYYQVPTAQTCLPEVYVQTVLPSYTRITRITSFFTIASYCSQGNNKVAFIYFFLLLFLFSYSAFAWGWCFPILPLTHDNAVTHTASRSHACN